MAVSGLLVRRARGRYLVICVALITLVGLLNAMGAKPAVAAGPCGPPVVSVIACENTLPGDPPSDWQVSGAGDSTIQGFATSMSVNVGETESFKINTPAKSYHIDILRIGYYQGNGARKVAAGLQPTAALPQSQPACKNDTAATGLIDCGNWGVSASWSVPSTAVSGLYVAHLVRDDTGGDSLIPFVVRNDASHSDLLFQTSDETWEAYNTYGGNSLYSCTVNCPPGNPEAYKGADKVSYNRPFHTALDDQGRSWFMYTEYPMIRFLEANGYDVSYMSGLDVATRGSLLLNHKTFLSVGHDEYWSGDQRANVEAARNAGVNLAFFSGNEVFWKTRWEPSIDGSNTAGRTLVTYKETHYDAPTDPQDPPTWTGAWADPRFSPPADGGRPQNALTGQLFVVNSGTTDIQVPAQYSKLRIWRNTPVANLTAGQTVTLGSGIGTLGYEWDEDANDGFRPAGLFDMSSTTDTTADAFVDYGSNTATRTITHHLTMYRAPSGALVFGAGTVQWSWGLDSANPSGKSDSTMQQATVNLLADMGAQPATLISGLTAATASTDTTPPTSTITSPSPGAALQDGTAVTITGTASDAGGGVVAGVEVSTDGGATWHPATGTTNWSYTWVAHGNPSTTIESRAVDDSGNLETPTSAATVSVNCPCSIFGTGATPGGVDSGDGSSINVGVKFTTSTFGTASGIRFYKAGTNTGTHIGSLWTASGQPLASATFTSESTSGWQQVNFAQPVLLNANTTYVASYFAPKGHYSEDGGYFYPNPSPQPDGGDSVDSPPLHALRNINGVTNGVYAYAGSSTFPASTFNAENYWVDVVFSPAAPPGQVTGVTGTAGYASAGVSWTAPTSGGPVTSYTITPYIGSAAQTPTTVTGANGSAAPTSTVITGLTNGTAYTFTVTASNPNGSGPASAASAPVTPSASASLVQNGGFESGLTSWTTGGVISPVASGTKVHSGSGAALLGTLSGTEPLGDSTLAQTITVPPSGTTTLSFWYNPATTDSICSGSSCQYDWQEAQIRSTSGTTLASVFKSNSNSQTWTQVSFNLTSYAGQNVVLWFNVHQDGSSPPDDTSMYLDDVSVTNAGSGPTAPGAPTGVSATAGNGSASVSWTAPSNGGSAITSYTVTPFIGSAAQTPVTVSGSPPATSTTVTGLTNGTTYTFTVSATNAIGTGPASAPSNAVTPTAPTAPGAPTGVTATAGDSTATVSWTAPSNGGSAITSYTVTPFIGSAAQTPVTVTGNPPATSTTVTGLTDGTTYTFTVSATNAIGTGPASAPSNAVTPTGPTAPGAPTGVTATAGDSTATVSWTAPNNGGSAITSYTVTGYVGSTPQAQVTVTGSPPATSTTVTGLTNGTTYTFTVSATNAIGTGPASAASNPVTPAAAGPITVDKTVFVDGSGTMTSPSLSTSTANDLVVAFVSGDGPSGSGKQTYTVSGAGLTWTLAKRSNTRSGDSEIWWARASGTLTSQTVTAAPTAGNFHGSLTVIAFSKAAGIGTTATAGAASGAPDLPVSNTGIGSWVYAVGNDWDNAIARTPVSGQVLVHQRVDTSTGDTFWVQSTTAPNTAAGTVDIHDSAPTTDQWNYAGVEVLPGT
jgi:N,N-dimethylformamidase beta subunit-like, C-terminal/Domain of unknown function (DUF4082)/Fibronectin type III domain/Bacterial Ig domain